MTTRFASTEPLPDDPPARSYPRPSLLAEPIDGPKALARLGIETWGDLIEHLPHAHRDRRDVRLVGELAIGEEATVAVAVRGVTIRPMRDRRRKRVEARVFDESGPLVAVWFNQPWIARQLGEGSQVLLHGKLRKRGEFWVSEHEPLGSNGGPVHTVGLVPVHPATEGISAGKLRELMSEARSLMLAAPEPLPAALRVAEELPDRPAALSAVHFPESEDDEQLARRRLAFEELFLLQLAVAGRRRSRREGRKARPLAARGVVVDRWRWSLPFELTADQVDGDGGDRRRPRPGAPDAAAADGRGGQRQDRGRARGHAARRRERRPGSPDGADGDARRAAPPHDRPAARRHAAAGAAHRLDHAPRGGATCSTASRTGSCNWSSAPTR